MRPRLNALTTLRFFAALHVVLFHMRVVGVLPNGPWWYQNFASIGFVGVNFFFFLSGFILVYTYDGPALSAKNFWRARFARIYPAYLLSLVAAAPFFFFAVGHLDLPFFAWSKQHLVTACILTLGLLQSWVPLAFSRPLSPRSFMALPASPNGHLFSVPAGSFYWVMRATASTCFTRSSSLVF